MRGHKRQVGALEADGGRQSRRDRQEADGGGFLCPALESSLTPEGNGDHWKTLI